MKTTRRIRRRRTTNKSASNEIRKKENDQILTPIQTKLTIGQPGDKYEKEADAVAKKVVSNEPSDIQKTEGEEMVQTKPLANTITPLIQTQIEEEEEPVQTFLQKQEEEEEELVQPMIQRQVEEEEEPVQVKLQRYEENEEEEGEEIVATKANEQSSSTAPSWIESKISENSSNGKPLNDNTKTFMETRIGADFNNVRIHDNERAAQLSQGIHAQAFTTGSNIYFNRGKYAPETASGKKLLAHELTHVVQQGHAKSIQPKYLQAKEKPGWKKDEERFKKVVLSLNPKKPKSNGEKFKAAIDKSLGTVGKKKVRDDIFKKLQLNPRGKKILSIIGMGSYGVYMLSKKKVPGLNLDLKLKQNMWFNITTGGDFKKPKLMLGFKLKF